MGFKKNLTSFIFIGILGTLSHFVYEWTNKNIIAGFVFPVNESVWEHLKLLFFPIIIYSIAEYIFSNNKPSNYFQSVLFSVIYGMFWIVSLFYTINGVVGRNIDFINILIYYFAVFITIKKKNEIIEEEKFNSLSFYSISVFLLVLIMLLFVFWTYNPLSYGIFTPPN